MLYYILFDTSLTAQEAVIHFLITIFVLMISLSVHEFSHALSAYIMGDKTPKAMGRLTLNPFKHLDTKGFVFFMLLGVGWAKPVPINPLNFKKYKKGVRLVSISGILANFLLGLLAAGIFAVLLVTIGFETVIMIYVKDILIYFMLINSFLALFNLLPIYMFDGYNFITSFMKTENKFIKFSMRNGFKIIIGIILLGFLTEIMFGFDIFSAYLSLLFDFVYIPISFIGVL